MDKLFTYDKKLDLKQYREELGTIIKEELVNQKIILSKKLGKKSGFSTKFPSNYGNINESMSLSVSNKKYSHSLTYQDNKTQNHVKIVLNQPILLDINSELKYLHNKLSDVSRDIKMIYQEIINVYLEAMEKMLGDDFNKKDFKSINLAELEIQRSSKREYNKILNSKEFLSQIKQKNEYFKKYKEFYYSIYRDIHYLESLEKQYKNKMTKKIEHLKSIEYVLNQKFRIVFLKLKEVINSFGTKHHERTLERSNLVEFNYSNYVLFLDKTTDILYSYDEETDEYISLGKRFHYTIEPIKEKTAEKEGPSKKMVCNLLLKYLFLRKILGIYLPMDIKEIKVGDLVKFVYDGDWHLGILKKKSNKKHQVMVLTSFVNSEDDENSLNLLEVNVVSKVVPIRNELWLLTDKFNNVEYCFNLQRYYSNILQKNYTPYIRIPEDDIELKELESKLYPSISFQSNNIKLINNIEDYLSDYWVKKTNYDNEPLLEQHEWTGFLDVFVKENEAIIELIKIILDRDSLTLANIEEIELSNKIMETLDTIEDVEEKESKIFKEMFGGEGLNYEIIEDFNNVRAENVKDQVVFDESFGYFDGGDFNNEEFIDGDIIGGEKLEEDELLEAESIDGGDGFFQPKIDENIKNITVELKKKR